VKKINQILTITFFATSAFAETENRDLSRDHGVYLQNLSDENHETEHEHVFTPEQETEFKLRLRNKAAGSGFRFEQTKWDECRFNPSGNFTGYACARSRQISQILQDFLENHIYECVDAGLRAQGLGVADDIHIIHDGILGDPNHSSRSLHAEARAIDIKSFTVKLTNGQSRSIVYAGTTNRRFYRAFRTCWGRVVNRENGCPFIQNNPELTGSIGWEDRNHQRHMHTSVPYCVNGRYGAQYFQR
jgi:hypothetical protein